MVQGTKKLHSETVAAMRKEYGKRLLDVAVPFSSEVEKMGVHRAPVGTFARNNAAVKGYDLLCKELLERL